MDPIKYQVKTFGDERGWLKKLEPAPGVTVDNFPSSFDDFYLSQSERHVFRGFHMQLQPHRQVKLIRVVTGAIISYILNLDRSSSSFKALHAFHLDAQESMAVLCPPMHGNGFLAVESKTTIAVLSSGVFAPSSEVVISPSRLACLKLPDDCILSEKDKSGLSLTEFESAGY